MVEIAGDKFEKIEVGCLDQRKTRKWGIGDLGLRIFWPLYRSLKKEAKKRKPAFILYPVPPWYIMVMAPFIKRSTGIPYAIDFIDPWVHSSVKKGFKAKMSQWIARRCEGFAVKNSSAVFAVSEGILNDLVTRYPAIRRMPLVAVPYGVESSDFLSINPSKVSHKNIMIRYTGAISEAMMPVVNALLKAAVLLRQEMNLRFEFTGTSYAGAGMSKCSLTDIIRENNLRDIVQEQSARVGYREALELSLGADMQLLIGDTTPYYAASKLMGMVASGRPFFAIVHNNSFPASFLRDLKYEFIFEFDNQSILTEGAIVELAKKLSYAISKRGSFRPVDPNDPVLQKYTAYAMTKTFSDTLKSISNE